MAKYSNQFVILTIPTTSLSIFFRLHLLANLKIEILQTFSLPIPMENDSRALFENRWWTVTSMEKSSDLEYLKVRKNPYFTYLQSNLAIVNWSIVNNGSIVNFFWLLFNLFIT